MPQSRSSTLNMMEAAPEGEPDFASLFQEQDQNPGFFNDTTSSGNGEQGHGSGDQGRDGRRGTQEEQDRLELQDQLLRLQQKDLMAGGGGQRRNVDTLDRRPQGDHTMQYQNNFYNTQSREPTQEELLRAWSMAQSSQAPFQQYGTPFSGPSQPQSHQLPSSFQPTPPAHSFHSHQGYPTNQPFPSIDPMNYRSPARDRASLSPQPSPGFHPTHVSQNSLTHSLSPRFGPSDDFNFDGGQMNLSAPLGGGNRRLSAGGQEGALTPSYAGSVFSGLGELEDQFAGGWGNASDNGGAGGSYAPSTHGQEQYQDLDFDFDGVTGEEQGGIGGAGVDNLNGQYQGGVFQATVQSQGQNQVSGWDDNGYAANGAQGLRGLSDHQPQVDDGYMRQRIAEYIASTTGQESGDAGDAAVMFAEPSSFDDLALLTGQFRAENAGFASQQGAYNSGNTGEFGASPPMITPPNAGDVIQGALTPYGPSEFARRMNSMASDKTMSSSGNNTPAQATFPPSISVNPSDGIIMPPFPIHPEVSLADRRSITSTKKRNQGQEAATYTPTFIKPSPPIGRAGLTKQPHLQHSSNKPASPPQLVIPDGTATSSTPSGAEMGYQPYPHQQSRTGLRAVSTLAQPSNGLLGIPAGGNGMSGPYMSPIGPFGPSINIVPSTPTSAMREGLRNQGIWENLAAQARQNVANGLQQSPAPAQQTWDPTQLTGLGGQPSAYAQEGQRRNSHAGVYTVEVAVDMSFGQQSANGMAFDSMPNTAPLGAPSMLGRHQPLRQRSRSETDLTSIPANIDMRAVQQAIYLQAMSQSNGGRGAEFDMGVSALETGSMGTPSPQPSLINGHFTNAQTYHAQHNHTGSDTHIGLPHVIAGPEAFGGNFIITNDGRRVPFGAAAAPSPWNSQGGPSGHIHPHSHSHSHSIGSSNGSVQLGPEEVDAMILAMADVRRGSMQGLEAEVGGGLTSGHRVAQSEDTGGRTGRKRIIHYSPSPEPVGRTEQAANGSLLPPVAKASPSVPRSRDTSPYSRPVGSGARRASNASSVGSTSMARVPSATSSKGAGSKAKGKSREPAKPKVTSEATEMASKTRRTADGHFVCPVPGCGSTFTRQFNLKGHIRSHNEERPFVCPFDNCDKSFARAHDCKRHQQLHVGLKPFQCEGCTRMFARLDALSRHHKTDSGVECARAHPLPTNPDGSLLTETKFKAEMARRRSASASGGDDPSPAGLTPMSPTESDEEMEEDIKPVIKPARKGRKGSVLM